ncbi:MAG: flavodoxin family protein [Chloroflexi bacterium]|nr:flavodoxin family protein [Chloroflexota bacterium]
MAKQITIDVPEKVKVLGISFSPRRNGNTAEMVKYTLKAAESMGYVETEYVSIADYHLSPCTDCKKCVGFNRPADETRQICYEDPEDQSWVLHDKRRAADALLVGFPVYSGNEPAVMRCWWEKPYALGDDTPFFNVSQTVQGVERFKPKAVIAQGGQQFAGQERSLFLESTFGIGGFYVGAWPTADAPEPQASYMGGCLTCVDGKEVYNRNAWSTKLSRVNPPLTGERNERTLRNLGRWLAVASMMLKVGKMTFKCAELKVPDTQMFVRYAAAPPKPGSVLDKLIKEGKVTYVPPEEVEARKRVKA